MRKYRERKKARTEYLEGEVARLQSINGQLVKRLQGQTAMAAELHRLRGILSDLQRMLNREMAAPSALGGLMDPGTEGGLSSSVRQWTSLRFLSFAVLRQFGW